MKAMIGVIIGVPASREVSARDNQRNQTGRGSVGSCRSGGLSVYYYIAVSARSARSAPIRVQDLGFVLKITDGPSRTALLHGRSVAPM